MFEGPGNPSAPRATSIETALRKKRRAHGLRAYFFSSEGRASARPTFVGAMAVLNQMGRAEARPSATRLRRSFGFLLDGRRRFGAKRLAHQISRETSDHDVLAQLRDFR